MQYENWRERVVALLENYLDMQRKITVLRYEMEHPATISPNEMISAMSFARGNSENRSAGHISNKTLYIAMNYQNEAARLSSETMDEIACRLFPLERETDRLMHHVSLLSNRHAAVIRLYYFERVPWDEISKTLQSSVKTLRKLRNEAVDSLAAMYELAQGKA